jgi:hypothetical protein
VRHFRPSSSISVRMSNNLKQLDDELNQMILEGKVFEAMERFYAPEVEMQENNDPACVGLAANFEREKQFFASLEKFHGAKVTSQGIGDGVTFSEWVLDVEFKGAPRMQMHQAAVRHWKNGKIVKERFYHA